MTTMIPVLPCASIPEALAFYKMLGFEVTHEQVNPNPYAATRRGDIHLHFMGIPTFEATTSYSTCLVLVPEVEALHRELVGRLREAYGKMPVSGLPRITRMKPGQSRFTVVDVAGNSVVYIRESAPDDYDEAAAENQSQTRLGKVLRAAARLRDFKNDDDAAAKLLEAALKKPDGSAFERAKVMAARAEIGVARGEAERVARARAEIAALPLEGEELAKIEAELAALDQLGREVQPGRESS